MSGFGLGQSVARVEDPRLLRGRGKFVDDLELPGMAYAVFVRSPHAHARILRIDDSAARETGGLVAILTAEDTRAAGLAPFTPLPGHPAIRNPHLYSAPMLAAERVRYVGDPVAIVIGQTLAQAKDAAEQVSVEYEPLSPVVSTEAASAADAPLVWDEAPGNLACEAEMGNAQAVVRAFAIADHVERLTIANNRLSANAMEPRVVLAAHDPIGQRTTIYTSHQAPHRLKQGLAQVLGVPETDLRVVCPDVGGGFGMKSNLYVEDALIAFASRQLGRPVKWTAERGESLMSDAHARERIDTGEIAFARDGRMLGIRVGIDANLGAYVSATGQVPAMQTLRLLSSVYAIPAIHGRTRMYYTNTTPIAVYRGAGRPEAMHLIERIIDAAGLALGIAPDELRRRNHIAPDALPYRTHSDLVYDSGEFGAVLARALDHADLAGFPARREESRRRGKLRGFGVGQYIELSGQMNERMGIRVEADATVLVLSGTFSHGQGHETVYAQMASEWLGVPFDKVRVLQGDTDRVPGGRGTFGARSMVCGGGALRAAADEVIERGRRVAGVMLETSAADIEFSAGMFSVAGSDRRLPFAAVARAAHAPVGPLAALGMGLEGSGHFDPVATLPNGCHVAEVEIDPETGETTIERYVAVDDVGFALNPRLVEGQVHGGVAQGIGQALSEQIVYDADGQLLAGSFMDYAMPRADDLPDIEVLFHNVPATTHPLGVKGAGEAGTVGALPAVMNAILDAVRPIGIRDVPMPLTAEALWRALNAGELRSPSD